MEFSFDARRFDLNLLVLFDALFRLRSVQAAASECAVSPSAFSHALTRMRESLQDELFYRVGNTMKPSVLAEQIAPSVASALKVLDDGMRSATTFNPLKSDRTFVFSATDYTTLVLFPRLVAYFKTAAPRLRIQVVQSSRKVPVEALISGAIDFALGYTQADAESTPLIHEFDWFTDRYVVVTSRSHSQIQGKLTLEQFLAARHLVVAPWGEAKGPIDHELAKRGWSRQVAVRIPSVLAAPFVIANSELVLTLPLRAAHVLKDMVSMAIHEPPFEMPYRLKAFCHAKRANEPAHSWMRKSILKVMQSDAP
ncbi:MAG TPA: LysR family transcriptional regulator [Ideonella sp.]|uniref:LysR family transcriptional regulator n=1 Tax=Ideonella sp. TaxID=1929293 RepID=UPI002E33A23A|nr:LysR family transcriptional regulator [Ideonella sp.]HEX5683100.1 LysR family transcriptional regulator [Ideonella sp.]